MKKLLTALISAAVIAMPLALVPTTASAQAAVQESTVKAPKAGKSAKAKHAKKSSKSKSKAKAKAAKAKKAASAPAQ